MSILISWKKKALLLEKESEGDISSPLISEEVAPLPGLIDKETISLKEDEGEIDFSDGEGKSEGLQGSEISGFSRTLLLPKISKTEKKIIKK